MDKSIHSKNYRMMIASLREEREKRGITQENLANMLGVKQNFISKIETYERRLDLIELRTICSKIGLPFVSFVEKIEKI